MEESKIQRDSMGLLPIDNTMPPAEMLRVSLAGMDQFRLPIDRRGIEVAMPRTQAEAVKLADEIAETVRKTALWMTGFGDL